MVATTSTGDDLRVRHTFTSMMNESGASFLARLSASLSASYCNLKEDSSLGRDIPTSENNILPCAADVWTAMAEDERVVRAVTQLASIKPSKRKTLFYLADACNAMSLVYAENMLPNARDDMPVVFFDATYDSRTPPRGDFLDERSKSDWVSFLVPLRMLRLAVATAYGADPARPGRRIASMPHFCSHIVAVGACLTGLSESGGLDTDEPGMDAREFMRALAGHKRYRPDLKTMHGFFLAPDEVWFASVDAFRRTYHSATVPDDKDAWISFVVLVYDAVANRDMDIALLESDGPHVRYRVASPAKGDVYCVPFYSAKGPGRMTWAAFEVASTEDGAVCKEDCRGFIKVSWQDKTSAGRERKLFNKAHEETWLPGLARNWDVSEDENLNARESISSDEIVRVKEITHLASVGDPLSHCKSALQAFMLFFDLVGVHREMLNRDVLHCDISWYNVLCNPWHHPDTLKIKRAAKASEGGRCIEYILTGNDDAEPCVLLTDLDHGAALSEFYQDDYSHRKQRTGTPLFIAIELGAGEQPIRYSPARNPALLCDALRQVEKSEEFYKRAFPADDIANNVFMKNLETIVELEEERRAGDHTVFTDPQELHRPVHDVESMFWVFLWLFIRALPEGFSPKPGALSGPFVEYVTNVLRARREETTRASCLFGQRFSPLTHEELHHWLPALEMIAIYFSIPWTPYLYGVSPYHAHIAVRRLLLSAMLKHAGKNVAFNCWQPRSTLDDTAKERIMLERRVVYSTRDSDSTASSTAISNSSATKKRKTRDDDEDQPSSVKTRLVLTQKADTSLEECRDDVKSPTRHCCRKLRCNPQSAGARCEKVWNDRSLWFDAGVNKGIDGVGSATAVSQVAKETAGGDVTPTPVQSAFDKMAAILIRAGGAVETPKKPWKPSGLPDADQWQRQWSLQDH